MLNRIRPSVVRLNKYNRIYYKTFCDSGNGKSRGMVTHHRIITCKNGLLKHYCRRYMRKWKSLYAIWEGECNE